MSSVSRQKVSLNSSANSTATPVCRGSGSGLGSGSGSQDQGLPEAGAADRVLFAFALADAAVAQQQHVTRVLHDEEGERACTTTRRWSRRRGGGIDEFGQAPERCRWPPSAPRRRQLTSRAQGQPGSRGWASGAVGGRTGCCGPGFWACRRAILQVAHDEVVDAACPAGRQWLSNKAKSRGGRAPAPWLGVTSPGEAVSRGAFAFVESSPISNGAK